MKKWVTEDWRFELTAFEGKAANCRIGLEKGEKNAKIEAARKMLHDGLSIELAAKYSGLSIEDVSNLVH